MASTTPLANQRHEKFAQNLVAGMPASRAYLAAGYDVSLPSAEQAGSKLSRNIKVATRVAELKSAVADHAVVTTARVTDGLAELAFVDIGDLVSWDDEGHVLFTPSSNLTRTQRASVKRVTHVRRTIPQKNAEPIIEETVALELESKKGALDSLARSLGMFRDTIDINLIRRLGAEWGLTDAEMESAVREAEAIAKGKVTS